MKYALMAAAAVLAISTSAHAGLIGDTTNNYDITNNTPVANAGAQAGAAAGAVAGATGGNATGGSVAGQGPGFGFAHGGARIDKDCNARADAQILYQLGEKEAAVLLLSAHSTAINAAVTEARTRK